MKARISKVIQSGGLLDKTLDKLGKKVLLEFAIPLVKNVLPKLATKTTSFVLDNLKKWTRSSTSWTKIHFVYLK